MFLVRTSIKVHQSLGMAVHHFKERKIPSGDIMRVVSLMATDFNYYENTSVARDIDNSRNIPDWNTLLSGELKSTSHAIINGTI